MSSNGRTHDSGSCYRGSNPCTPARSTNHQKREHIIADNLWSDEIKSRINLILSNFFPNCKILQLQLIKKNDLEEIIENLINFTANLSDHNHRSTDLGCVYLGLELETGGYYLDITINRDLIELKDTANSFWKILALPRRVDKPMDPYLKQIILPVVEIFANFLNIWSVEKLSVFPYLPEVLFYDYDFDNFDFVLVSLISPLSIEEIQMTYQYSNSFLISGEFESITGSSVSLWDLKIDFNKICNHQGHWHGDLDELARILSTTPEKVLAEIQKESKEFLNINSANFNYCGSKLMMIQKNNKIHLYTPDYFVNVDKS